GDWQLLPWIMGRARDQNGRRIYTPIPPISRWKMVDNLRRTLVAPGALLTLIAGWTLPFASPVIWTMFIVAVFGIPAFLPVLSGLIPPRRGISKRSHARAAAIDFARALSQLGLKMTFLAHQASLLTDAILRTLFRLYVTRRRLLEWVT